MNLSTWCFFSVQGHSYIHEPAFWLWFVNSATKLKRSKISRENGDAFQSLNFCTHANEIKERELALPSWAADLFTRAYTLRGFCVWYVRKKFFNFAFQNLENVLNFHFHFYRFLKIFFKFFLCENTCCRSGRLNWKKRARESAAQTQGV